MGARPTVSSLRWASVALVVLGACRGVIGFEDGVAIGPEAASPPPEDAASTDVVASSLEEAAVDVDAGPVVHDAGPDKDAPPNLNLAARGNVVVTSLYDDGYRGAQLIDGTPTTSWFSVSHACYTLGPKDWECRDTSVTLTFTAAQTVGRVRLVGTVGSPYAVGYDVLSARIELIQAPSAASDASDASEVVLFSAEVVTNRGPEPNGNADLAIEPPRQNVIAIRVTPLTAESGSVGFGELEAFADPPVVDAGSPDAE